MKPKRINRLNSLLKEVIAEVIRKDVCNPNVSVLATPTKVEITPDLHYAKVYISIIGNSEEKEKTIKALQESAGYIGSIASKKVVLRYFPSLTFILDNSVEDQMKIEKILQDIKKEESSN